MDLLFRVWGFSAHKLSDIFRWVVTDIGAL